MAGKMPPAFLKNIKAKSGKPEMAPPAKGGKMPAKGMPAKGMMPAFKKGGKVGKGC